MKTANDVAELIALFAPVGLVYSWYFYFTHMRKAALGWRDGVTLLSLVLVSLVVLLWPVMMALTPRADWGSGFGVAHQVQWVEAWHTPILRTLLSALVLSLFGRPRLIGPIAIACIGIAIFWIGSTMP